MYPVDWAKTHLQANRHASTQDMTRFFQKQTIRTMYRGVGAVFVGVVPAHSAYYSLYEIAKDKFGANRRGHHPLAAAASGAVATIAHDFVMTPLDVVKQRMQLGMYKGVLHAMTVIIKTEGLSSLLLSLPTTILMNIPAASVNVAVNESCRRVINPSGNYDWKTYMMSGTIAGGIAGAVTNPLDVIKTRLQTQTIGCNQNGCGAVFQGGVETVATPTGVQGVASVAGTQSTSTTAAKPIMVSKTFVSRSKSFASTASSTASRTSTPTAEVVVDTCARRYNGFWSAATLIMQEEGLRGFSRGTLSRALTQAPAAALSWTAYEYGKRFLSRYDV